MERGIFRKRDFEEQRTFDNTVNFIRLPTSLSLTVGSMKAQVYQICY